MVDSYKYSRGKHVSNSNADRQFVCHYLLFPSSVSRSQLTGCSVTKVLGVTWPLPLAHFEKKKHVRIIPSLIPSLVMGEKKHQLFIPPERS